MKKFFGCLIVFFLIGNSIAITILPNFDDTIPPGSDVRMIIESRIPIWEAYFSPGTTIEIDFSMVDLGTVIDIGPDAEFLWAGDRDITLAVTDDFTTDPSTNFPSYARIRFNSNPSIYWFWDPSLPVPTNLYDGQSVTDHEICHALGFSVAYELFDNHVQPGSWYRTYVFTDGQQTATLTLEQTHLHPLFHPNDLMNPELDPGLRREPSDLDIDILNDAIYHLIPGIAGFIDDVHGGFDINGDNVFDNYYIWERPNWYTGWIAYLQITNIGSVEGNYIVETFEEPTGWNIFGATILYNTREIELGPGETGTVQFGVVNPNYEDDVTLYWKLWYDKPWPIPDILVDQIACPSYSRHIIIRSPNEEEPAVAGYPNAPSDIDVVVYAEHDRLISDFSIQIGNEDATILSLIESPMFVYTLAVTPPNQIEPGFYDITCELDGIPDYRENAVQYLNPNTTYLSFIPQYSTLNIPGSTTISASVIDVDNLHSIEANILFNPQIVHCTSITEGDFLNENSTATTTFYYEIDNEQGIAHFEIERDASYLTGVSCIEYEEIASLDFSAVMIGTSALSYENPYLFNPSGDPIEILTTEGSIEVSGGQQLGIVSVEPPEASINLYDQTQVEIQVAQIENLFAFAVDVLYNPQVLNPIEVVEGTLLNENGTVETSFQYTINENQGVIIIGVSRLDNSVPGVSTTDPQTAVSINFESLNYGDSEINLQNVGLIAPDGLTNYPSTVENGIIHVPFNEQDVDLYVSPENTIVEQGEDFDIDIDVGPVEDLFAFAADFIFEPDILEIISVEEGNFLSENGTVQTTAQFLIDNESGLIVIGIARLDNSIPGASTTTNANLLTIHINAENAGESDLTLENVGLIAPDGQSTYNAIIHNGFVEVTEVSVIQRNSEIPKDYFLTNNSPNPFNRATLITYGLPKETLVEIHFYNSLGQRIDTFNEGYKPPGVYHLNWDASKYSSGLYFYHIIADDFHETKKCLLIK